MREDILRRFDGLRVWQSSDGLRAPNKPLLALWALGRCLNGHPRFSSFQLVDEELSNLLIQFGPYRKTIHTEFPFWYLQNDNVWVIDRPGIFKLQPGRSPSKKDFKDNRTRGGLREEDYQFLKENAALVFQIANALVTSHFPHTLHEEVLDATLGSSYGISNPDIAIQDEWIVTRQKRRDPYFRKRVFETYGPRCAVCGFAGELKGRSLALEAAHIKWHEAKGPAIVQNGLVLCSLHHRLFDTGAFTLLPDLKVRTAQSIKGEGVDGILRKFDGERLKGITLSQSVKPEQKYLDWHRKEVFGI